MPMKADFELDAGGKTFASGLLPELIAAVRHARPGNLIAVLSNVEAVGVDLETWCRFTHNSLVARTIEAGRRRWVVRYGEAPEPAGTRHSVGSRLWLYTNFDCNLRCDYCCVRSSPTTSRRELGVELVRRIVAEARPLGLKELFVTGGEPFLLPDIAPILRSCAAAAPTTVLTNAMLFR